MAEEKKPFRPMRSMSICIDDVPAEAYVKSEKNGKTYINITNEELEPDQWGNDQTYYIQQTAEQRKNNEKRIYVGRGKTFGKKNNYTPKQENTPQTPTNNSIPTNTNFDADKDLPF